MVRLAVIGANGQVGAELCLLLAREPDISLVPVCRTRSGSAFLRAHGLAVRHGSSADPTQSRSLLGDCQLVVNSSLATGSPGDIRAAEDAIIGNALRESAPDARVIHFSTQSVYGDPRPDRVIRWRNPYGRAKLGTERTGLALAGRLGKQLFVLRLGHVGGALQAISEQMRSAIAAGNVLLPERDLPSNLVYTVTIVDAIRRIAQGQVAPGVYDLMNVPQLSWRAVHDAECLIAGLPQSSWPVAPASRAPPAWRRWLAFGSRLVSGEAARNSIAKLLAHAPATLNARAHAWWHVARARSELAALLPSPVPAGHFYWVTNGSRFIPVLTPTAQLLAQRPYEGMTETGRQPWPEDLPLAFAQASGAAARLLSTAT